MIVTMMMTIIITTEGEKKWERKWTRIIIFLPILHQLSQFPLVSTWNCPDLMHILKLREFSIAHERMKWKVLHPLLWTENESTHSGLANISAASFPGKETMIDSNQLTEKKLRDKFFLILPSFQRTTCLSFSLFHSISKAFYHQVSLRSWNTRMTRSERVSHFQCNFLW